MSNKELLIVTGMSGAGRSTVAHALEDLGWYVVDNLPPALLPELATQTNSSEIASLAVVVDVRGGKFFDALNSAMQTLKSSGVAYRLLFLDATDQSLVGEIFSAGMLDAIRINVLSFGYKYGIPVDSDLVLDCRFIPNPHWIPELRPLTGLTTEVSNKVLTSEGVTEFVKSYVSVIRQMMPGYLREGKKYVTIAIGCTGGKHRSVAIAAEIARQLSSDPFEIEISAHATHRDVGRE
jgi:UPF0042 nucleotide-binding protein